MPCDVYRRYIIIINFFALAHEIWCLLLFGVDSTWKIVFNIYFLWYEKKKQQYECTLCVYLMFILERIMN